jgi:hypothetical protein
LLWLSLSHFLKQKRTINRFIIFISLYVYIQDQLFLKSSSILSLWEVNNYICKLDSLLKNNTWYTKIHLACRNKIYFPDNHNNFLMSLDWFKQYLLCAYYDPLVLHSNVSTALLSCTDLCILFYFLNILPAYDLLCA